MADKGVILIQMPDSWVSPSLALSILKSSLTEAGISCRVEYASHFFMEKVGAELLEKFQSVLVMMQSRGWELVFARSAGFSPNIALDDMLQKTEEEIARAQKVRVMPEDFLVKYSQIRASFSQMQDIFEEFLEEEAERILACNPAIVGFHLMTQQRNASFALIKRLKARRPDLITVVGGGICVGETAKEYLRLVPELDYVFTGEADRDFAKACQLLLNGEQARLKTEHPWLLARGQEPMYRVFENLDESPEPDFSDYYAIMKDGKFAEFGSRPFPVEASRGCWWAMIERCRFCGLHYCIESAKYRLKSVEKFWREVESVYQCGGNTDFQLTDCIINRAIIQHLPDECPESRQMLKLFAECRSDLTYKELKKLKANKFLHLQPGIESLQDDILTLMNKGRKTEQQLQFLLYCRSLAIMVTWNIIYKLPGDKPEWYEELLALMKKLHHLQPPSALLPMLLARGSIFYQQAGRWGADPQLRASELASDPNDRAFTEKTAEYFVDAAARMSAELEKAITDEAVKWREDFYRGASLVMKRIGEKMMVFDKRDPDNPKGFACVGTMKAVLEAAVNWVSGEEIAERLQLSQEEVAEAVEVLAARDLLYQKDDHFICLAVSSGGELYEA